MKPRHLLALLVAATPLPAAAGPHKLLVLQSEGRADAATRARIDAAIAKLARTAEPQAAIGDLSFSDAATAVGCKPDTASCRDEVLGMLAVDELVFTTASPVAGGLEIAVHRIARGGAARDATMLLATGAPPDKLDGIAPLFGIEPAAPPPIAPLPPPPSVVALPGVEVAAGPTTVDQRNGHPHLEIAGMTAGGAMVVVGLVMWGSAKRVQHDIDRAPAQTQEDLSDLRRLESRGATYATLGNAFAIAGVVTGGVATYFYLRDRRAASSPLARLTPTVFDHGGGLVLTLGSTP